MTPVLSSEDFKVFTDKNMLGPRMIQRLQECLDSAAGAPESEAGKAWLAFGKLLISKNLPFFQSPKTGVQFPFTSKFLAILSIDQY